MVENFVFAYMESYYKERVSRGGGGKCRFYVASYYASLSLSLSLILHYTTIHYTTLLYCTLTITVTVLYNTILCVLFVCCLCGVLLLLLLLSEVKNANFHFII